MKNGEKPIANPLVILREEFDDWAVLFDPDTGNAFGLNPTGVYVWKLFDGKHSIGEVVKALHRDGEDVPQEAGEHLAAFVEELSARGLVGYNMEWVRDNKACRHSCPACISEKVVDAVLFTYEPPKLINLSGEQAEGACCSNGTSATGIEACCSGPCVTYTTCYGGNCHGGDCQSGTSALGVWCADGTSVAVCGNGSSTLIGNCAGTGMSAYSRCNGGSGF